jgi:hypothetical protein
MLSTFMGDLEVHQLPIVYTGSLVGCADYATQHGYEWRRDSNVFGGYYAHPPSGVCLFITTATAFNAPVASSAEGQRVVPA